MKKVARRLYDSVINPPSDETLNKAWEQSASLLPVVWLLGKTGAGKSTIVQKLTGQNQIEIGTGFKPCTQTSSHYDYPPLQPIIRFLDTRGLGEVNYDASEDLRLLTSSSHAVMIVLKVSDSEQHDVISALKQIKKEAKNIDTSQLLVVHTCMSQISNVNDQQRAIAHNQAQVEKAWGQPLANCAVELVAQSDASDDITSAEDATDELKALLSNKIPEIRLWLLKRKHVDAEQENFERFRSEVLWYAGIAAASDSIPLIGTVSVPGIQGKMLHSLAQKYGINWDRRNFAEFIGALGLGFGTRYVTSLVGRQLGKLIPFYGQSAGTVFSVSISYGGTYALGRAACSYLYHKKTNKSVAGTSLKDLYKQAIKDGTEKPEG